MKYVDATILLLFIVEKSVEKLLVSETQPCPIHECIVHILNEYFNNSIKVSMKYSSEHSTTASEIMRKIDLPILTNAHDTETKEIDKRIPDDVCIIIQDSITIVRLLMNQTKWNARTQFLIITNKSQTSEQNMIDIFQEFWASNIVKILILAMGKEDVQIYTFIPFNPHDCAVNKPVLLATWTSEGITPPTNIIQKDRVTNLNGCTLNASFINEAPSVIVPNEDHKNGIQTILGMEGSVLMEISNRLNFKLNLAEPTDGKKYGFFEPKPHGAVGELFYKKTHFSCAKFANTLSRYKYLDVSVPVSCEKECISWLVPIGAKKALPTWTNLLVEEFSIDVWYLIAASAIFTATLFRILSKTSKTDQHLFGGNIKTMFYIYRSSLGASVNAPKHSILRTAFLTWLWYTFVIYTAYQAFLGSKLTVPYRKHNIKTFKDLLESDLHITGMATTFKIVEGANESKDIKNIGKRYAVADFSFPEAIEKIISGKKIAYLWMSTYTKYIVSHHTSAKGLVYFMDQCGHDYYPTILLQKNCPFTEKVNRIIQALMESGILCKWKREYVSDIPKEEPSVQKLSLNRMKGSIMILAGGLGAAIIAFMAEIICFRLSCRKKI